MCVLFPFMQPNNELSRVPLLHFPAQNFPGLKISRQIFFPLVFSIQTFMKNISSWVSAGLQYFTEIQIQAIRVSACPGLPLQPARIFAGSLLAADLAPDTSNPAAGISLLSVTEQRFWKSNIYLFHWGNFINQDQSLLALASDIMGSLKPANCE